MGEPMRPRTLSLAATALATAAGFLAVTLPQASAAAAGCQVTYQVSGQWQGGFQGDVAITNLGDPVSSWTLGFDFPTAAQKVTQGWSATWTQSGAHVTAAGMSWNGSLGTGASTSIGFIGSWSGSNPVPSAFTLNGVACTGSTTTTPPTPPPTTPPPPPSSPPPPPPPSTPPTTPPSPPPATGAAPALKVSGNKLVTASGAT